MVSSSKYQSGFRKSKSTNDHLFHLSQTIMESFNRGEHAIAAFLDVEKAFDNIWHNGSGTKCTSLICPPSFVDGPLTFQLGESYRLKLKVFCHQRFTQTQAFHKVQTWVHYFFLSMSMTCQILVTTRLTSRNLQMTPANGPWVNIDLSAEYLQRGLDKLARWCTKWRIKLNPEKIKVMIFSKSQPATRAEPAWSLYGDFFRTILA